jgi:hypothetical protein
LWGSLDPSPTEETFIIHEIAASDLRVCNLTMGGVCVIKQGGSTALVKASLKGHIEVVKLLAEAGAKLNHTNQVSPSKPKDQDYLHAAFTTPYQ